MMKRLFRRALLRSPTVFAAVQRVRGCARKEELAFLRVVKSGSIVFDVGANIGHFTELFSVRSGRRGEVHAFEPIPRTFNSLVKNTQDLGNVVCSELAISDIAGTVTMYIPGDDFAQASSARHSEGSWGSGAHVTKVSCRCDTLDSYVLNNGTLRVDVLKIDAEGAELKALSGFASGLKRFAPILFLEISYVWSRDFGYTPVDLVNFLRDLGYSHFWFVDRSAWLRSDSDLAESQLIGSTELICFNESRHRHLMRSFA